MLSTLLILLSAQTPTGGTPVIPSDALLTTPVGGLERTRASAKIYDVVGQPFRKALRVTVRQPAAETNWTQLTVANSAPVAKGDVLLGSFWVRGGMTEFLFEKSTEPWTKSATQMASAGARWKRYLVPIVSAESYQPGEAMVSLRFAQQPQTVEVGGLSVTNYRRSRTLDQLIEYAIGQNPLGTANVALNLKATRQTMMGFGGDFCQPRYGSSEPMDVVGSYNLAHLNVVHARVGFPLNVWNPEPGVFKDAGPAHAALQQLQILSRRKIPLVLSVWEGPGWMLGGRPEQSGRTLAPEKYADCIDAIARFLVRARDTYHVEVGNFSFNEPDYGVNFRFTPRQMADFIRQAGPVFAARRLKTKFLVADTANGTNTYDYALPLLEDRTIRSYLGPISFHCWDALGASEQSYRRIAELGRRFDKQVWCLEAGHDAALWQKANPWASWENALRTALAYVKTLRLTEASLMDYWTYQDNYPLVDKAGPKPYPVFHVVRQMEGVFYPGARVSLAKVDKDELWTIATAGKGRFGVLMVNLATSGKARITGLPARTRVKVVTSVKEAQMRASTALVDRYGRLSVTVPMRSVVTVVGP